MNKRKCGTGKCDGCRDLAPVPQATRALATSRCVTSRGFMALARQKMHESFSRYLGEFDIGVMSMDGKCFRERRMLVAMGVGCQGNGSSKQVVTYTFEIQVSGAEDTNVLLVTKQTLLTKRDTGVAGEVREKRT